MLRDAGGQRLQGERRRADSSHWPCRHDGVGSLQYDAVAEARELREERARPRGCAVDGDQCGVGRGEAGLLVATGDGVREPQNRRVEIMVG